MAPPDPELPAELEAAIEPLLPAALDPEEPPPGSGAADPAPPIGASVASEPQAAIKTAHNNAREPEQSRPEGKANSMERSPSANADQPRTHTHPKDPTETARS